jgi:hypothetical protein
MQVNLLLRSLIRIFVPEVMKKITILCLLLACALPALAGTYRPEQIPNVQRMDRQRYVSDPDGILSAEAVARIDSVCASLRERGLAQVAVVAVDDIAGGDTFSFAVELFRGWGVGSAKSNNGLGILLVKELREIRFVTGGGLEGILPDALCKRIQTTYMLPAFRAGNYSAGMVAGEVVYAPHGITFVAFAACCKPERYLLEGVGPVDRDAQGRGVADHPAVIRHGVGQGAVRCGEDPGGEFSCGGSHPSRRASCQQQQASRYPVFHLSVVFIGLHRGSCARRGSARTRRVPRLSRRRRRVG